MRHLFELPEMMTNVKTEDYPVILSRWRLRGEDDVGSHTRTTCDTEIRWAITILTIYQTKDRLGLRGWRQRFAAMNMISKGSETAQNLPIDNAVWPSKVSLGNRNHSNDNLSNDKIELQRKFWSFELLQPQPQPYSLIEINHTITWGVTELGFVIPHPGLPIR